MSKLESNTTELEEVLAMANALPNANSGSDGVVVARFSTQDPAAAEIFCDSHTHGQLFSYLDQGRLPVIAHITIESPDNPIPTYITANCWAVNGIVYVGEYFGGYGWYYSGSGNFWVEF